MQHSEKSLHLTTWEHLIKNTVNSNHDPLLITTAALTLSSTIFQDSTPSSLLTQDVTKYHKAIASPYQDSNNLYDPSVVFAKLLDYPDKYSTVIILANQPVHHYLTKTSICWSHEQLHIKCCIAWCRHWRRHGCWLWIWRNRTWASARAGWNSVVYSPSKPLKL